MKEENKEKTIEFPTTDRIQRQFQLITSLEDAFLAVLKPVGWLQKHYDTKSILTIAVARAKASTDLWDEIYKTYPETRDGRWICSALSIKKEKNQ